MDRRLFLASFAATAMAATPGLSQSRRTPPTLGIREVSVIPYDLIGRANGIRGRLRFRVSRSQVLGGTNELIAYAGRECPELIVRYAQLLGFTQSRGRQITSVGDGRDAATNFQLYSGGLFSPPITESESLPKLGAVLSVGAWSSSYPGRHGHVAIVWRTSSVGVNTTSATVTFFDQNMRNAGDAWKTVTFTRPALQPRNPRAIRLWRGEFENRPASGGVQRARVSWTDPTN